MANLEVCLKQEIRRVVKTPFPRLFDRRPENASVKDVCEKPRLILLLHTYH